MKPDQPSIDAIFLAAIEIPGRAERSAYLDQACSGEFELRERIDSPFAEQKISKPIITALSILRI